MMKKLSKIALLAAASAFMLAVFPACGDDEEEADPKATLTLVGDPVELEKDTPKAVTATVTLENDTFNAEAKKIAEEHEIPTKFFELKATDAKVTVSAAKVKKWDSDTKATITFTVTAADGAADGTISAEIEEGTLTSNKTLTTAGNISYTIKSTGKDPVPSVKIVTEATSMTVEVKGTLDLMAVVSDFPEGDVTYDWESDKMDIATVDQNPENMTQARVTAIAAGTAKIKVTAKSGDTEASDEITVTVAAEGGGDGDDEQATYADAVWNFEDAKYATAGLPTANGQISETTLAASSGSGATLSVVASKGYYRDNKCVHIDGGSNKTQDTPTNATGTFTLTLEKSAYVTVHLNGTGAARTDRWVVIADSNGTVLAETPAATGLDSTERDLKTDKLNPGTYKIYANFARIFKITLSDSTE